MRCFVTGATGFVGSHLVRQLVGEGVDVAILMRANSNPWRIDDVLSETEIIYGDLMSIDRFEDKIKSFEPDKIFHLGWHEVGSRYRNDPSQVQNLYSSLNLLKLAKECNCNQFIGLGSQAEYGSYNHPIREDFLPHPTTAYGATKLATYVMSKKFSEIFGLRFVWLRLFSSYGPMDDPNWMLPHVILKLLRGDKPALTLGKQLWDYLFVEDAVNAIWQISCIPNAEGLFNVGSGKAHTIKNILEIARDLIDPSLPLGFGEIPYRPDQVMHLQADITRLKQFTNWSPKVSLEIGLKKMINWFVKNKDKYTFY
jgi:UDP-glucose 4-epimerase